MFIDPSHLHTPKPTPATYSQTAISRRPTNVRDLEIALPSRTGPPLCIRRTSLLWSRSARVAHEVPHQDQRIVGPTRQQAAVVRTPLDAVDSCAVALELEQSLPRLSDVEDADGL